MKISVAASCNLSWNTAVLSSIKGSFGTALLL
uniref:Uncharacterized protein n=1 Tax=Arundo donax TaxID=35708 RepID=A0A0A9BJ46_ARUDO